MNIRQNGVMVQIGTNDGNDEFNFLCRNLHPSVVLLVEPNPVLNPYIFHNYDGIRNLYMENVAITEINKGLVKLYLPTQLVDEEKTKKDFRYATGHFSLLIPVEWYGEKTGIGKSIEVPSMTFNELCEKYHLIDIDYLQIDTEGYDSVIIQSIDFDKHNIRIIQYESTVHWETEFIVSFLESKGYTLSKMKEELNVLAEKN